MKICPSCNSTLNLESFPKNKSMSDGLSVYCRRCCAQRSRAYRQQNRDLVKIKKHLYYLRKKSENPAWSSIAPEKRQAWRQANPQGSRGYSKSWRAKNPEKAKEMRKVWVRENPGKCREMRRNKTEKLTDGYVRTCLTAKSNLSALDIPQWLVNLKRQQLLLLRALKKEDHENC